MTSSDFNLTMKLEDGRLILSEPLKKRIYFIHGKPDKDYIGYFLKLKCKQTGYKFGEYQVTDSGIDFTVTFP